MIHVDDSEIRAFSDQLRGMPKNLRADLRKAVRAASEELVLAIQANASWSERIPPAVKVKVGFGQRTSGVLVYVDSRMAPHARPLERGSQGRSTVNRHPVFGTDTWVEQPTRPYFMKAARSTDPKLVNRIQEAINDTFNRL